MLTTFFFFFLRNLELLRAKVVLKKSRSASIDGIFGLSSSSLTSLREGAKQEERGAPAGQTTQEAEPKQSLSTIVSALRYVCRVRVAEPHHFHAAPVPVAPAFT
jgi:hypothetical protein